MEITGLFLQVSADGPGSEGGEIDGIFGQHEGFWNILSYRLQLFLSFAFPQKASGLWGDGGGVHIENTDYIPLVQYTILRKM